MSRSLVDEQALVSHLRDDVNRFPFSMRRGEWPISQTAGEADTASPCLAAADRSGFGGRCDGWFTGSRSGSGRWKSPQSQARAIRVANGDFETFSGPIETGFPSHTGMWGGNPAEVIEEADGNRRLRLLKTGKCQWRVPMTSPRTVPCFSWSIYRPFDSNGKRQIQRHRSRSISQPAFTESLLRPMPNCRNSQQVVASTCSI